jgi:hypothetical protein
MEQVKTYTFEGVSEIHTFTGIVPMPVAFNFMLHPDADPTLVGKAGAILGLWITDQRIMERDARLNRDE